MNPLGILWIVMILTVLGITFLAWLYSGTTSVKTKPKIGTKKKSGKAKSSGSSKFFGFVLKLLVVVAIGFGVYLGVVRIGENGRASQRREQALKDPASWEWVIRETNGNLICDYANITWNGEVLTITCRDANRDELRWVRDSRGVGTLKIPGDPREWKFTAIPSLDWKSITITVCDEKMTPVQTLTAVRGAIKNPLRLEGF